MLLPTQAEIDARRETSYRQRSLFLVVGALLILASHAVDRVAAGGAAPTALALRLAWCVLLLCTALGLRRGGPLAIGVIRVAAPFGSVGIFLGLILVTGRSGSPVFSFIYLLVMMLPLLLFDALPYGLVSSAVALVGSWVIVAQDGVAGAPLWGWVHIGVTAFALGWVLAMAFAHSIRTDQAAADERREALVRLEKALANNQQLVGELREALANVKTLRGLLPICAFCKKIRNDEGYWEQLEGFVSSHSDARFSHSFCPECMAEQYPEHVRD